MPKMAARCQEELVYPHSFGKCSLTKWYHFLFFRWSSAEIHTQWVTFILIASTAVMSSLALNWLSALPCLACGLWCHLTFLYSNSMANSPALDSWFQGQVQEYLYLFHIAWESMGGLRIANTILPNNSCLFLSSCRHPCWFRSANALWDGLLMCSK